MRCLIFLWIILTSSTFYAQSWPQIRMGPANNEISLAATSLASKQFRSDQELEEILTNTLLQLQEDLEVKGLSAAIHFGDGSEWAEAVGFSSLNPGEALSPDHYFSMGSVGKTIVAAAILLLYERDSLSLDDNLGSYGLDQTNILPEVTIRQLLRHESGIFNYTSHPSFNPTIQTNPQLIISLQDIVDNFVADTLFIPGSRFSYSNTNFVLLAQIIESVTGQAFSTFIRDQLLDPLGLQAIFMPIIEPWQNPLAHLWIDTNGDGIVEDFHDQFITWPALLTSTAAPGGYFSTASELTRWMYAYQSGQLHSPATLSEAREFRSTNLPAGTQYGLGLSQRIFSGYEAWGHQGDLSYSTQAWYFPELDLSLSIHCHDGSINSWQLSPVTLALLEAYLNFQNSTAIQNPLLTERPHIFPNPNNGWLNIHSPANKILAIEVYDALGRTISTLRPNQEQASLSLNTSHQSHLWIKVITETASWTELIYLK